MNGNISIIENPETHRLLYILLLIATPFLLLQNYLQSVIGELSNLTYPVGSIDIPVTVTIAVIGVIIILFFSFRKLNFIRLISWFVVLFLFWIGQKSTDYYFNHKFYELQYNWHYFAYAIFAYLNYRALSLKNLPSQKIILLTFISALATSTLDEFLQMPLSNRIFDIGDISKDVWGTMIGLFVIYFILENGSILIVGWKIRQPTLKDYFKNPLSLLILLFMLAYIFMVIASLLTETTFILSTILITFLIFGVVFLIIHLTQFKLSRNIIIIVITGLFITQGYYINKYFNDNIISTNNNILIYKGIPIVYFDVLIYPDGLFRLVDKKKVFNQRDQQTIFTLCDNIIVFGTGYDGDGGKGFPLTDETQFVFNESNNHGIQIILQKNKDACDTYNRLKAEGKNPLLIYHNN
ncbi:MAG: VanZ family protein [Bacteroidetes bacterium]|nr:VanZ family protein [Bacteroidota bacterium]